MSDTPQNVHKKLLGRSGEKRVEKYLKKQGCTILHRNYVTPFGEADLIVRDKDEIAFVEVKTRLTDCFGAPREAVREDKQRRYRKIAQYYWVQTGEEPNARFDVAEVYEKTIEYYKNAY